MQTRRINQITLMALVLTPPVHAADAIAKSMEISLSQQRQAVSSMAASLEAQRQSFARQAQAQPASSFFTQPPLRPVRGVTGFAPPPCPPMAAEELDTLVGQAADREDLEPDLLRSVIQQESAARPCAVSRKGALGLMQLMPATALQLGVEDVFDPKENIDAGARFLKQLLKAYGGNVSLALGAFNAGPAKVNEAGGLPDYPETLDYVRNVLTKK